MAELQATLNALAGTNGMGAQGAANIWAGTNGMALVGALNTKAGISRSSTFSPTGNLLTVNQASLETDTTGWNVGPSYFSAAGGYTLTRDATDAYRGAASGKVVGDGTATYQGPYVSVTGLTANTTYTVCAVVKTSGTGPGVSLNFRDKTGSANYQSAVVSSTSWTEHRVTFTTGASAGMASFSIAPRTAAAETFWFDAVGLWQGTGGTWAPGGSQILISAGGWSDLEGALNVLAGTSGAGVRGCCDILGATVGKNLIPANGASFETDASYWDINASLTKAVTNTTCAAGTQSLLVTMNVNGGDLGIKGFTPGSNIACTAGNTYTVVASFLKGLGSRQNYYIYGEWRNAGNTTISTFQSTKVTANTWTEARVTATAPALTTSVQLWFIVFDTGVATDTFYVDKIGMWQDNPTAQWTL